MRVFLVNPSDLAFKTGLLAPRWLYVLAAATPRSFGDPIVIDETLDHLDCSQIQPGDVVGIGIHTSNALRGYKLGKMARQRGAYVIFGGIHASLYPDEAYVHGSAHAVVKGDGDVAWGRVLTDCTNGGPKPLYEGGQIEADQFIPARWDLMPAERYSWASVQTVRGCPKHCSFCSVWRTDGQRPRERTADPVIKELVELRRLGFRFIVLADDNFYPVTLKELEQAKERNNPKRLAELQAGRDARFELMARLAELPKDMVLLTQITMEVAEDPEFLDAMHKARILGALVGIESVTPEGLKTVYKNFNTTGDNLVRQLQTFQKHGVHVLGSFIFGLSSDKPDTFSTTAKLAQDASLAFAQFVTMVPFPGTVDFMNWEKRMESDPTRIAGFPLTRYWLMPRASRPRLCMEHPLMSAEEIRTGTQGVWDSFYSLTSAWKRSGNCAHKLRSRLAFVLVSKLFRQMFANVGIATDSARIKKATTWAGRLAKLSQRVFRASPMPELQVPKGPLKAGE